MKRLFLIRERKLGPLWREADGSVRYFENKLDAKQARNLLNAPMSVVSYGPDHKKCQARDVIRLW